MSYMDELARKWREHDRSFEGRDVLPNGDEVWTYTTLELGLPVLWLKHPEFYLQEENLEKIIAEMG